MKSLETQLRTLRASGRKALVPYFVAGLTPDWLHYVDAAIHGGADVIEIGIPFSDPMMDGVVIQEAAMRSLARGTTLDSACSDLRSLTSSVPLVAMTYYNIIHHYGLLKAAGALRAAHVTGAIIPDLTLEESGEWVHCCASDDVANIFLTAPSTDEDRVAKIANVCEGFSYASARMAVTGKSTDEGDAHRVVDTIRAATDIPIYVGIGITTPGQAQEVSSYADGVIVGSALVQQILSGATPQDIEATIRSFRQALDQS